MSTPVVGVVGGGQLARMMFHETVHLGLHLRFLVTSDTEPVVVAGGRHELGSATSNDDLRRFAETVDVMTFDHEVVDLEALASITTAAVRPGPTAFATVSDKARMRRAMTEAGLPVPPTHRPTSGDEAADLVAGGPHVIKLAHGGYDGRGTHFVDDPETARALVDGIAADGNEVLVEPLLDLDAELAVVVVRGIDGEIRAYDPVRTVQVEGQCRLLHAPSGFDDHEATRLAVAAAEAVDSVGVVAVELFLVDGRLMINELASRPHNSGHHTIDAAVTSQFENHVRAVAGLPLGDTSLTTPAVATANLIGVGDHDPRSRLVEGLGADPGAHIHLYDKGPRHDRKLGHVTVCDDATDDAVARVAKVVEVLGCQEVPT